MIVYKPDQSTLAAADITAKADLSDLLGEDLDAFDYLYYDGSTYGTWTPGDVAGAYKGQPFQHVL